MVLIIDALRNADGNLCVKVRYTKQIVIEELATILTQQQCLDGILTAQEQADIQKPTTDEKLLAKRDTFTTIAEMTDDEYIEFQLEDLKRRCQEVEISEVTERAKFAHLFGREL